MDNFTVSPVVEQTLAQLKALPCVKTSLDFLKTDSELTLEQQVAMAKIPAPTFHEREKALAFCEYLKELGLEDVHLDRFGNAIGVRRGSGKGGSSNTPTRTGRKEEVWGIRQGKG